MKRSAMRDGGAGGNADPDYAAAPLHPGYACTGRSRRRSPHGAKRNAGAEARECTAVPEYAASPLHPGYGPRLLVTGFGPFPGAPQNPTEPLMRTLAGERPEAFGAGALKAIVLPTDYRRSWDILRRLYAAFTPDVVVHFGLSHRIKAIHVERVARNAADPAKPDAAGFVPRFGRARRNGPEILEATLAVDAVAEALVGAGYAAGPSDDAGRYVCNATLYRSLHAGAAPRVGFIHVPPLGRSGMTRARLLDAAALALAAATGPGQSAVSANDGRRSA